jgi:hypothetical protein
MEDDWLFRPITLANDGLALMELTSNYYQDHVKQGLWLQSDETQETILALKALQQQCGTYRRNPTIKPNRPDSRPKKQDKDWKTKLPRKGESTTKSVTIQGKVYIYHWCPYHRKWTIHPPKDCLLKKKETEKGNKKEKATSSNGTPTLKAMTAAFKDAILGESEFGTPFSSRLLGQSIFFLLCRPFLLATVILLLPLLFYLPLSTLFGLIGLFIIEYIILTADYRLLLKTRQKKRHDTNPKQNCNVK